MSKTGRIIMFFTQTLTFLSGVGALIVFVALTGALADFRWTGDVTREQIFATKDAARVQIMAGLASDHWHSLSGIIATTRWILLAFGSIVVASSIVHLFLMAGRPNAKKR